MCGCRARAGRAAASAAAFSGVAAWFLLAALCGRAAAADGPVPGERRVTVNGQVLDVTWDPDTRTVRLISAAGSDLLEVRDVGTLGRREIADIGALLVRKYGALLRIRPDQLVLRRAEKTGGTWYVSYQQTVGGTPVYDSSLGFSVDSEGRIRSLGAVLFPDAPAAAAKIGRTQALRAARLHLHDGRGSAYEVFAESLSIYPERKAGSVAYRPVYIFNFTRKKGAHPAEAEGGRAVFVDAGTGEVVRTEPLVRPLGCCLPNGGAHSGPPAR